MEPVTPQHKCPTEIWEMIFPYFTIFPYLFGTRDADIQTLMACRETCQDFKHWVDNKTSLWRQMSLQRGALQRAVVGNKIDICRMIIENVQDKNPTYDDWRAYTPVFYKQLLYKQRG